MSEKVDEIFQSFKKNDKIQMESQPDDTKDQFENKSVEQGTEQQPNDSDEDDSQSIDAMDTLEKSVILRLHRKFTINIGRDYLEKRKIGRKTCAHWLHSGARSVSSIRTGLYFLRS